MSSSNLQILKDLHFKNYEIKNIANKKDLENISSKLPNCNVNFTGSEENSFENLCKQQSINDEKVLRTFNDVAVTGKYVNQFI